jgi:hypothetical protein
MKNIIPRALDDLFSLAGTAADGLHSQQAPIGIMHNTETLVRADLEGARTRNNAFQAAKTARLAATENQTSADENATAFISTTRDVLKQTLGRQYSQAWDEAGFTSRSLAVPRTIEGRMSLLKSLELYLTAHPELEVASLNVTAAQAAACHGALSRAASAINAAWSDQRAKREARDEAVAALQERLRKLLGELSQFLSDSDPRWMEFGFNVPADSALPDVPEDVTVIPAASGHLLARWSPAPRASRYHVYKQVVGVDPDFVLAATVTDTAKDMNTFTPGMQVKVRIAAVNDAGASPLSDAIQQVVV